MDVEELFETRRFFLKLIGMWPRECECRPTYSWLKANFALGFNLLVCFLYLASIVTMSTPEDIFEYFLDLLGFMTASVKIVPFVINRRQMLSLYHETKKFESTSGACFDNLPGEAKVKSFWRLCRSRCIKFKTYCYVVLMTAYCSAPLFDPDRILPMKILFKPNSLITPWYEIAYAANVIVFIVSNLCMMASDTYLMLLLCQLCEELELIKLWLSRAEPGDDNNSLMIIARRHVATVSYGEKVCDVLSGFFFSQHYLLAFIICFSTFTAITTDDQVVFNKMLWLIGFVSSMSFFFCFLGEVVVTVSQSVADSLVASDLLSFNGPRVLESVRTIGFMLMRAQKPLKLAVGTFGLINLQFFSSTMSSVYSFTVVLRTAYD